MARKKKIERGPRWAEWECPVCGMTGRIEQEGRAMTEDTAEMLCLMQHEKLHPTCSANWEGGIKIRTENIHE